MCSFVDGGGTHVSKPLPPPFPCLLLCPTSFHSSFNLCSSLSFSLFLFSVSLLYHLPSSLSVIPSPPSLPPSFPHSLLSSLPTSLLPPSPSIDRGNLIIPPLQDIKAYKIIVSTLQTSRSLALMGLNKGHFTHIFIDEAAQVRWLGSAREGTRGLLFDLAQCDDCS